MPHNLSGPTSSLQTPKKHNEKNLPLTAIKIAIKRSITLLLLQNQATTSHPQQQIDHKTTTWIEHR